MYIRPRCKSWTPLATQQLRLRSLIRIIGLNITCNSNSKIYFTLHMTALSSPFYTSEKIHPHGSGTIEWPEILCEDLLKSTKRSITIRVWEHDISKCDTPSNNNNNSISEYGDNSKRKTDCSSDNLQKKDNHQSVYVNDKVLLIWGIHFSGLVLFLRKRNAKFYENSLLFEMKGGFFASPNSLTPETIQRQINSYNDFLKWKITKNNALLNNTKNNADDAVESPDYHNKGKIITNAIINTDESCDSKLLDLSLTRKLTSNSIRNENKDDSEEDSNNDDLQDDDDDYARNYINSNSNNTRKVYKNTVKKQTKELKTILIPCLKNSYAYSPSSSSSQSLDIDMGFNQSRTDSVQLSRFRFISKSFPLTEIHISYSLSKLLSLQAIQRKNKQENEDVQELIEKISVKSASCLNVELAMNRQRTYYYTPKGNASMGRTLNRLLFEEPCIKPEDIVKAQNLRSKIERAKYTKKLLTHEKEKLTILLRNLEKKLTELHDRNIDTESWLMSSFRALTRGKEDIVRNKLLNLEKSTCLKKTRDILKSRRLHLCQELKMIYPLDRTKKGTYRINNVILPNAEHLFNDTKGIDSSEHVTPSSLSVALGYVAHATQMCSLILNSPLRNPIKHEGSRSKIMDVVRNTTQMSMEFPLHTKSSPPPKAVFYAIYLLNQNIAQLNFEVYNVKCDLRTTLPNLVLLLNGEQQHHQPLEQNKSATSSETENKLSNPSIYGSSEFKFSVPSVFSQPIDVASKSAIDDSRISRSAGSYSDELSDTQGCGNKNTIYNSEPILTTEETANFPVDKDFKE